MSSSKQLPSVCPNFREQVLATVLQLIVQHVDVKLPDVTTWLQLSKTIRTALQQASGNLCYENFRISTETSTALAQWLPRHAGLVSRLKLCCPLGANLDSSEWAAAEQMISLALQLSSSSRSDPISTAPQGRTLPVLQLKYYSTDFVFQPAALGTLASSNCLTQLRLAKVPTRRFTAELCTALGRLRGLRSLSCSLDGHRSIVQFFPAEFVTAVAELAQLETLDAYGYMPVASLAVLPASLTQLCAHVRDDPVWSTAAANRAKVQLGHLTRLQSLDLMSVSPILSQTQLPAHLTCLKLLAPANCGDLHGLSELKWLHLPRACVAMAMLQHLAQQPKLQELELGLYRVKQQQLQQVADALGTCRQLTELHLYHKHSDGVTTPIAEFGPEHSFDLAGMRVQLQDLRQLQVLRLTQIKWDLKGFSQLTVLSSITSLEIENCDIADAGLAVVFQRLTGLRKLTINSGLPDNECLLVAMACLTNLERLSLIQQDHVFTDATLPLLSPLTKLTHLSLHRPEFGEGEGGEGADPLRAEVEEEFVAGMPSLDFIDWLS